MQKIILFRDADGSILYAVALDAVPIVTYRKLSDAQDALELLEDICAQ